MKKLVISFLAFFMTSVFLYGQQVQSVNLTANESKIELTSSTATEAQFFISMDQLNMDVKNVDNKGSFALLEVDGMIKSGNVGLPQFPVYSKLIEVPYGATIEVEIISYDVQEIDLNQLGYGKIYPTQPSYSKSSDPSDWVFQMDNAYYTSDKFVKTPMVNTEIYGVMRGVRLGRVEVCPFQYNPVQNKLKVFNNMSFKIKFLGADIATTEYMKNKYYSPEFEISYNAVINYKAPSVKDAYSNYNAPLKYVIVAEPGMATTLQPFIQWKRKSGFNVIEAYTDVIGSTNTAIKSYLQGLYDAGTSSDPAPLYVLIIGDHSDIPAFNSQTDSHITDVYYATYDGGSDYLPDLYYGRISAETTTELQNALDKIIPYEEYTITDGSYLNNAMVIAGVDATFAPSHGNGTILYGVNEYFNTSHNLTNIYAYYYNYSGPYYVMSSSSSSAESDIISKIGSGVGFANYTAHCDHDGWSDPAIRRADISSFNNTGKYPFMIGNCCLSFEFNQSDAFGEMLLYTANEGAVGYIGTSNYSYWDEDVYWDIGLTSLAITSANANSHDYSNTGLGAYDGIYHENGESYSDWHYTARQIVHMGNMSVQSSSSSRKQYYWEIYHCSGDPSLMPYMYEPPALSLSFTTPNVGATSLTVSTEDYTYVAISQDGVLLDAKWSGSGTSVTLTFPAINGNDLTIVGTKQNRAPYINENVTPINSTTPPTADFVADQTVVTQGTTVNFTDLSTEFPTSWSWSFPGGTPTSSTDQNPSVVYNTPGTYDVTLTATNAAGSDTETKTAYITVNPVTNPPVADFVASQTNIVVGSSIDFTDLSTNLPDTWSWTFDGGTPNTSNVQNPTGIVYNTPGTYDVTLTASNSFGSDTETKTGYIVVTIPNYCDAAATDQDEYISNVTFNTIDNSSNWNGYADYTSIQTTVIQGNTYNISITNEIYYSADEVFVWIDYNMDGDFDDAGEDVFYGPPTGTTTNNPYTWNGSITIPTNTAIGSTRMRIRLNYDDSAFGTSNQTPCGNSTYGEVEDYTVVITSNNTPPVANFTADVTSTCTGVINFTDQSTGATSWSWDFGDGNTSTDQNPTHTYTSDGTYTVTLTATNAYGSDVHTETDYITVSLPVAPTASDVTNCGSGSVTLTASGSGTIEWYDAATGGNLLATGNTYTTPSLTSTTTYYVQDHTVTYGSSQYVGSTDNSANGAYFTNNLRYLIFDALSPIRIVSVEVNANGAGVREVELRDNSGTVINSASINIPDGISRITLNFDVPAGTDYQLGLSSSSTVNLYRNNAAVSYPYEIPGLVSIKSSDAGTGYYYFYYDWEVQEINDCISARTPVDAIIETPLPVDVTVSASNTTICSGDNVTFTATGTNGGTNPTYEWFINGNSVGTGTTYSSTSLNDGDVVTCQLTSSEPCNDGPATSTPVTITVNPVLAVDVSVTASNTTICSGDNVTFTATGINEGTNPVYEWFINGNSVGAGPTYSTTSLNDGDVVTCQLTSSETCTINNPALSTPLTMTVNPAANPSITITADATSICVGDNVTFTSTVTDEGSSPSYEWQVNGTPVGTAATLSTTTLNDGDVVTCILTSSEPCASGPVTSNAITMTVGTTAPVDVSISSDLGTTICGNQTVTFTATPTNEGATPTYQWYLNGNPVGTNGDTYITSSLNDGDVITCQLTSSLSCATGNPATSLPITMTVNPAVNPSISISASATSICAGDNVTFTSTVVDEGTNPAYEWQVNGVNVGSGSTFSTSTLNDGDVVTCILTSSEPCSAGPVTSNTITMSVGAADAVDVTISSNAGNTICTGDNVTFTATPTNEGSSPVYQWYLNGNPVGTNSPSYTTNTLNDGDYISCVLTSSNACSTNNPATSNTITMTVSSNVTPSINISASATTICAGDNVTFTSSVSGEGSSPVYDWQVNGTSLGSGSTFSTSTLNDGDVVTCILTSSISCATVNQVTSNSITVNVNQDVTPTISIVSDAGTTICQGDMVTFTANVTNEGANPVYEWQVNGVNSGSGSTFSTNTLNNGDVVTCILTSSEPCASNPVVTSNALTFTVESLPVANFYYSTSGPTVTFTDNSTNATSIMYYFGDGNSTNMPNPVHTYTSDGTYTVTMIATNNCGSDSVSYTISVYGVGVTSGSTSDIQIYPNPTNDLLYIELGGNDVDFIEIYDVIGELVKTEKVKSDKVVIDMSTYSHGVYMIKLKSKNITRTQKVIVSR